MTAATADPAVLTESQSGILVITINRPAVRNAVDGPTALLLAAAFDQLDADPELRIGILTGSHRNFSAGMDLKAYVGGGSPVLPGRGFGGLTETPPDKPLIAAVEGYALAGGFEMVLACDLIVASSEAQFGIPEAKRGLTAAAGGMLRLPNRIPYYAAMKLALTGDRMSAQEADRYGMLADLVEPGQALPAALELAARIVANAPLSVLYSKRIISQIARPTDAAQYEQQAEMVAHIGRSADSHEGALAFAEKRAPIWTGK
ncbi:MAG: enoyl-CoA hydratase [Frankiales bacterium]|nr:enoyl-CoA hydratase [Frankiales bacterium]